MAPGDGPEANAGARDTILFVVGNSRSGTTLMGRILGRHANVFLFPELHFFDRFWPRRVQRVTLSLDEALEVAVGLCKRQKRGAAAACRDEGEALVGTIPAGERTAMRVFTTFLRDGAARRGRSIPCEQTGGNVFYIGDIVGRLPEARIIDIVRDPRDVLLSQKKKWLARRDAKSLSFRLREYSNYHPVTTSALWAAAVREADRYADHPQVHHVHFEELLSDPDGVVSRISAFCGLEFDPNVLNVPSGTSSIAVTDRGVAGIDASRTGRWRDGGMDPAEVRLCELVAGSRMRAHGYLPSGVPTDVPRLALHLTTLPVKTGISFFMNRGRFGDLSDAIGRRMG